MAASIGVEGHAEKKVIKINDAPAKTRIQAICVADEHSSTDAMNYFGLRNITIDTILILSRDLLPFQSE